MLLRTVSYFYELKRNLSFTLLKLQEMQRKRLMAIVKHAYENVPFYHRKFDEAGIKPDSIKTVDDLSKIPTVTKSEIQSTSFNDVIARNVELDKCALVRTTGSTGKPLTLYLDKSAADFRFALLSRTYWEDGVRPWDKLAKITFPESLRPFKGASSYRGLARRMHISVFDDVDAQLHVLERYQPDFINSYPSSLVMLAHACKEEGAHIKPRLILTGSELLYDDDKDLIRSAFGCDSVDDYGCYEAGPLAWECREHVGYHLNVDSVVMEFLKDGEQVAPGECGEIACTSLINHSMPIIRYLVGDRGAGIREECSCGRPLPLMKMLEGRKDDFFTALDGRIISPRIFGFWPFENLQGIKQFKAIQERIDKLTIQIVSEERLFNEDVQQGIIRKIEKVFGNGMQVEFQFLDKIERDPRGKLRRTVSHVPVQWHT